MPSSLPEIVYHYTSMDALISIVEGRNLRATSIAYLNDHQERELFLSAVRTRFHHALGSSQEVDDELRRFLKATPNELSGQDEVSPFVASFSEAKDSLMHWRAYCPQQNGVAIGFRSLCLAHSRVDQHPESGMLVETALFGKVHYISSSDHDVIDAHIHDLHNQASNLHKQNEPLFTQTGRSIGHVFSRTAETRACFFKHHSFRSEGEYRLLLGDIRSREDALQFRSTRSTLVPFVPLWVPGRDDIERGLFYKSQAASVWDAIATLSIGPTVNMNLSVASVRALFRSKGMRVDIDESRVPYRDW